GDAPPQDLLGAAPIREQALADAQRARDEARSPGTDVDPATGGGLFSDELRQTDIEDAPGGAGTDEGFGNSGTFFATPVGPVIGQLARDIGQAPGRNAAAAFGGGALGGVSSDDEPLTPDWWADV